MGIFPDSIAFQTARHGGFTGLRTTAENQKPRGFERRSTQ
jgi:hypothetical protein